MASQIIHEWDSHKYKLVRRLSLEVISIEIMKHMFGVENLVCNRCSISMRDCRYSLIFIGCGGMLDMGDFYEGHCLN